MDGEEEQDGDGFQHSPKSHHQIRKFLLCNLLAPWSPALRCSLLGVTGGFTFVRPLIRIKFHSRKEERKREGIKIIGKLIVYFPTEVRKNKNTLEITMAIRNSSTGGSSKYMPIASSSLKI